jgi:hypothetical protein
MPFSSRDLETFSHSINRCFSSGSELEDDVDAADTTQAWGVYSCDFDAYDVSKSELHYTLAVR